MKDIIGVFIEPQMRFNAIENNTTNWGYPFFISIVLFAINEVLRISYSVDLCVNSISSSNLSMDQIDVFKFIFHKIRFYKVIHNVVSAIACYLFVSSLFWLILYLFNRRVVYINALYVFFICSIPVFIGDIVNSIIINLMGGGVITQYNTLRIGINVLFDADKIGHDLYFFLYSINPFQIYSLIMFVFGVKVLAKLKIFEAFVVAFVFVVIKIITLVKLI